MCAAAPELLEAAKEARDELSQYVAPWMGRLAARLVEVIKEAEDRVMSASFWLMSASSWLLLVTQFEMV